MLSTLTIRLQCQDYDRFFDSASGERAHKRYAGEAPGNTPIRGILVIIRPHLGSTSRLDSRAVQRRIMLLCPC